MGWETTKLNFQRVVAVTGLPGLYLLRSHNRTGFLVEPIAGGVVQFVSNAKNKIAALGNIDLALKEGSIPIVEVFKMLNEVELVPSHGASEQVLFEFFKQLIPELDKSKVYPSTMKKVLYWHTLLINHFSNSHINDSINEKETGLNIV